VRKSRAHRALESAAVTRKRVSFDRSQYECLLYRSARRHSGHLDEWPLAAICFWTLGPSSREPAMKTEDLDIESLRQTLEERAANLEASRWNADPADVQRSVIKLVLTLVEFLRQLLERQAIHRMENGSLTPEEIESVG